jgi:multidrug efflux pump subunit AcrA (membrane-fusion protein)
VQKTKEEKQEHTESYCCPNPNCNRVFYRPKIIKYYVCPTCQTLLKMDTAQGTPQTKKRGPTEEDMKRKEAERLEAEKKAEHAEAKRLEAEKKVERLEAERKLERLDAERKKAEQLEAQRLELERLEAERKETEKRQEVKSKAPKPIERSQTEQPAANAEEVNQPSDSGCKHYFGYLGQRDKGEEIPAACLECPKSLDCMLHDYKSKESVAEIKKWYPAKP